MKTSGLNILITTPHFPFPLIGGERIKLFQIIKHLSKNNKIFIVSLDRGYEVKNHYIDVLRSMNVETYVFKINKISSALSAGIISLFRYPLEIEYFRHTLFGKKIKEITENNKIDLVINLFIRTAEHVKKLQIKKILLAEDCRSFYQKRTSKQSKRLNEKFIRSYDAYKLARYEAEIMEYFDITTVVSNEDKDQMYMLNSTADIRILSQGVDTEIFYPSIEAKDRKNILFLGKLDVWANILMVNKIVTEIFPIILKSNPNIKLNIVGSNPPKEILKFESESIKIYKNPENITSFFQEAAVFLHPHLGGSGIQNKVLQSMASACPVVTSPSGANGIEIVNGIHGFIATNINEFANYSLELINNVTLRETIGINARNLIIKEKSWETVFMNLDTIIEEL